MKYCTLQELCDIKAGGTPSRSNPEYWNGSIPWIKISDIDERVVNTAEESITEQGLEHSSAKLFKKGTILYSIFASLGTTGILGIDAATNQAIAGINPLDGAMADKEYLYYYLLSTKPMVNSIGRGVAQNNINLSVLRNFQVPLLEINKQKHIVKILKEAEQIIDCYKEQLTKMDLLIKSRFVEMFGDPITNTKSLKTKELKDVMILKAGDFTAASDISSIPSGDNIYPCYGGNGIRGYVAQFNQEGDYSLIGRQGALSGNVQYAKGKFRNTEHALLVTPICEMNSVWLNQLLIILDLKRYQTGAAQPGLSVKNLQEIPIIIVSLDEQEKYASFIECVDKSKAVIQKSLNEAQLLFDSLMQEYFG